MRDCSSRGIVAQAVAAVGAIQRMDSLLPLSAAMEADGPATSGLSSHGTPFLLTVPEAEREVMELRRRPWPVGRLPVEEIRGSDAAEQARWADFRQVSTAAGAGFRRREHHVTDTFDDDAGVFGDAEAEDTGLARAIEALRAELGLAQESGANQQLRFEIEEAQLELLLELRKDVKPGVKFAFGVVTAGVDGGVASGRTHRLTLRLKVRDEALGGRNAQVSRQQTRSWDK